jgi:hypothetical protein
MSYCSPLSPAGLGQAHAALRRDRRHRQLEVVDARQLAVALAEARGDEGEVSALRRRQRRQRRLEVARAIAAAAMSDTGRSGRSGPAP